MAERITVTVKSDGFVGTATATAEEWANNREGVIRRARDELEAERERGRAIAYSVVGPPTQDYWEQDEATRKQTLDGSPPEEEITVTSTSETVRLRPASRSDLAAKRVHPAARRRRRSGPST